ncbi:MAG: hypothetical protein H6992_13825 [Pseudomonadales bacterium]|nr:hypothetical protein [Pseudomonadales bacterium]
MTADYLKNDISLNEALALLLGHNLWLFRKERADLLEELERDLADCAGALKDAERAGNQDELEVAREEAAQAKNEIEQAGVLYTKLTGEVAKSRDEQPTVLVVVKDDPALDGYDQVRISRQSLFDWAKQERIKVGSSHPLPTRSHTTPLLELLDELIAEFWEDHDEGHLPENRQIEQYVRDKYGDWRVAARASTDQCRIPGVSAKVIEAICTIMRPVDLRS